MKGKIFKKNIVAFSNIRKVVYFLLLEQNITNWMAKKKRKKCISHGSGSGKSRDHIWWGPSCCIITWWRESGGKRACTRERWRGGRSFKPSSNSTYPFMRAKPPGLKTSPRLCLPLLWQQQLNLNTSFREAEHSQHSSCLVKRWFALFFEIQEGKKTTRRWVLCSSRFQCDTKDKIKLETRGAEYILLQRVEQKVDGPSRVCSREKLAWIFSGPSDSNILIIH